MAKPIHEALDALPAQNMTTRVLHAIDWVAPGTWKNIVGWENSIKEISGETDGGAATARLVALLRAEIVLRERVDERLFARIVLDQRSPAHHGFTECTLARHGGEFVLRFEMAVEPAMREPRARHDVGDRDTIQPAFLEEARGRRLDQQAVPVGLFLRYARHPGPPW